MRSPHTHINLNSTYIKFTEIKRNERSGIADLEYAFAFLLYSESYYANYPKSTKKNLLIYSFIYKIDFLFLSLAENKIPNQRCGILKTFKNLEHLKNLSVTVQALSLMIHEYVDATIPLLSKTLKTLITLLTFNYYLIKSVLIRI